ncbi:MAG: hypothetical protein A2157_14565 [Deltaproteobacteria bacterium RBG_16_47_11]|nr:MAG: hypothetical protein A2157_14565 [Deltaproteobacteria bacterium RBG_16_47_11]
MASKTIRFELPFKEFLNVIDQLTPEEKLFLKKKLEKGKLTSWQERFGRALKVLGKKNRRFSEVEVQRDVKKAIAEVRGLE